MSMPNEWLMYVAKLEQDIKRRPETAPKRPRATGRLESPRMRRANTQTRNSVKAIYQEPSNYSGAIVVDPAKTIFTTELGGNCEPLNVFLGKSTQSREQGENK